MAVAPTIPTDAEQNAFLSGIGHICLQWALLEQSVLYFIAQLEGIPLQKAYVIFAHLDMKPRLNMLILLAQDAKLPHNRFVKPLTELRRELDKDGAKLADRRNMFVHGAHKVGKERGEYVLTMSRWKGDKQSQTVTLGDAAQLALELCVQAQKLNSIVEDYGFWKFGVGQQQNSRQQVAEAKAALRIVRTHQIKRAIKLLLANLKPW
jgi:hypothetical protein